MNNKDKIVTRTTWFLTGCLYLPVLVKAVLLYLGEGGAVKATAALPHLLALPLPITFGIWLTSRLQHKICLENRGIATLRRVISLTVCLMICLDAVIVSGMNRTMINLLVIDGIGVFFILIGSLMPQLPRNRLAGVRFSWTMADATVWQRSNKVGGVYTVILGIFMIVSATVTIPREGVFTTMEIWAIIIYIVITTLHSRLIALQVEREKK